MIRSDNAAGTSGFSSRGGFGVSMASDIRIDIVSVPLKAISPVHMR